MIRGNFPEHRSWTMVQNTELTRQEKRKKTQRDAFVASLYKPREFYDEIY